MPLYAYVCKECGLEFEEFVRFSQAENKPVCPSCGSENTQKQITTFTSVGPGSSSSASTGSSCGSSGRFT